MLRQIVSDGEPQSFGPDEDVCGGADCRAIDKCAHGNVGVRALADDRIQQGAALCSVSIVGVVFTEDE